MSSIQILSDELISQIAAGEVIERPASALKELVENSIDAGATRVTIELEEGGLKKIRVSDNGKGIRASEAALAFERHATSKLSKVEDLFSIRSLGFRGEALASIASIAQVILETRATDERVGTRIEMDGGKEISREEFGGEAGTTITVLGLFKHTPARKKYMKTERTEYGKSFEMLSNIALAHPEVGFRLVRDGKEAFNLSSGQHLKERIRVLYGGQTAQALVPVQFHQSNLIITGFVGKPELARSSKKYQFIFVNDRAIENRLIGHAVKEAFHSLLMHEKFPWYLLNIQIDPALVDVNVHPRKLEVKFVNQQEVYRAVRGAVHHALEGEMLSPRMQSDERLAGGNEGQVSGGPSAGPGFGGASFAARSAGASVGAGPVGFPQLDLSTAPLARRETASERSFAPRFNVDDLTMRPVAQIANSYIIAESEEGLVLIDQHAAHERVRYEQLMKALENEQPKSQALLTPLEMDLGADSARIVEEHMEDFAVMGFEIEAFGGNTFLVRSVPTGLENREPEQVVRDILADVTEEWKKNHGKDLREFLLTYTACRGAIKFGDPLRMIEMEELMKDMEQTKNSTHCPHGRPAVITFTFDKLEELFKRKNF